MDEKYVLVRLLGCGSMGEVWLAHHRTLGEQVAVKLLTKSWGDDVEDAGRAAERFQFEAQIAARLSRKTRHVVRVTDHGDDGGRPYLVMEVLEGMTLEAALLARGVMPLGEVSTVVGQIARGLRQAHAEGVLHRDLKPSNVFLTRDEDGALLVKLLDFGIAGVTQAHVVDARFATGRGVVFGTPGYMSPEQATGQGRLDGRCDLWALACIAYEAITGVLPVPGEEPEELLANLCAGRIVPLREIRPGSSRALDLFFRRAFAPRPRDRFGTASELAGAFERASLDLDVGDCAGTMVSRGSLRDGSPAAKPDVDPVVAEAKPSIGGRQRSRPVQRVAVVAACILLGSLEAPAALPPTDPAANAPDAVAAGQIRGSAPNDVVAPVGTGPIDVVAPVGWGPIDGPSALGVPAPGREANAGGAAARRQGTSVIAWTSASGPTRTATSLTRTAQPVLDPSPVAAPQAAASPPSAAAPPPTVNSVTGVRIPGAMSSARTGPRPPLRMDKSDVL